MNLVEEAAQFAVTAHGDQKYGDYPYQKHLMEVVLVLQRFGVTEDWLLAAAWLHDVLEDTKVEYDDLDEKFGWRTANAVYAVTAKEGRNRTERNFRTYRILSECPHGIVLKLADRIANVESAIKNSPKYFAMYKKEHSEFKRALYHSDNDLIALRMWDRLDKLFVEG